ncbi:MAG: GNAT family N-acetyltransferase [Myxococcota bacterium]
MADDYPLRFARLDEMDRLLEIEREAGTRFVEVGIDDSQFSGMDRTLMAKSIDADRLFVLADEADVPIAFALCETHGDALHLHELGVMPQLQGRGLGRRLLGHVATTARAQGARRVTLTTYRDVSFNGPFYTRYGFVVLPPDTLPNWLAQIRKEEAAAGLDVKPRIAMALDVA